MCEIRILVEMIDGETSRTNNKIREKTMIPTRIMIIKASRTNKISTRTMVEIVDSIIMMMVEIAVLVTEMIEGAVAVVGVKSS